jgi:predicted O-methyltransferase YrrM
MKTHVTIDSKSLSAIELGPLKKYVDWSPNSQYFLEPAGKEHYRLIAHVCSQLPKGSLVVDIGTYTGASALAASYNENIRVVTYDIVDHMPSSTTRSSSKKPTIKNRPNIDVRVGNCLLDMAEIGKDAALVILDVDPHDGIQETEITESLVSHGFSGVLMLDDTNLNHGMRDFYDTTINQLAPRFAAVADITAHGHFSGTGLLYDTENFDVQLVVAAA